MQNKKIIFLFSSQDNNLHLKRDFIQQFKNGSPPNFSFEEKELSTLTPVFLKHNIFNNFIFLDLPDIAPELMGTIVLNLNYFLVIYSDRICKYGGYEQHRAIENQECNCADTGAGRLKELFISKAQKVFYHSQQLKEVYLKKWSSLAGKTGLESELEEFVKIIIAGVNYQPTLSGYTTTCNSIAQKIPYEKSIKSMLNLCDQVVIVDIGSTDGTWEALQDWAGENNNLQVFQRKIDSQHPNVEVNKGGARGMARLLCNSDFCLMMEPDEVIEIEDISKIKRMLRHFPNLFDLICLPISSCLSKTEPERSWWNREHLQEPRISRNEPFYTHGVPKEHRNFDKYGALFADYSLIGAAELINSETFEDIEPVGFVADKIENQKPKEHFLFQKLKELPVIYKFKSDDFQEDAPGPLTEQNRAVKQEYRNLDPDLQGRSTEDFKFFIITACYNSEKGLVRLYSSLQEQSWQNWQWHIIDDLSTDGTAEQARAIAEQDSRVMVTINQRKKWALHNICDAIDSIEYPADRALIGTVDGDDFFCHPQALELVKIEYEKGAEVIWTAHQWNIDGRNISAPLVPANVDPYQHPWVSSHFRTFLKSIYSQVDQDNFKHPQGYWFRRGYDQALMLPILYLAEEKRFIPQVCYQYNLTDTSFKMVDEQIRSVNIIRSRGFIGHQLRSTRVIKKAGPYINGKPLRVCFANVNLKEISGPNLFASRLAAGLDKKGVKTVDYSEDHDILLAFIESPQKPKPGVKMVQRLDGLWFNSRQDYQRMNRGLQATYQYSNGVIFQSKFNQKLVERYFGSHSQSTVINNGIELSKPEPLLEESEKLQISLKSKFDWIFLCCSHWRPHKRLKDICRLFKLVASPNSLLFVAGSNPDYADKDPRIKFLGMVRPEQLQLYYLIADLFFHLAWLDHCPNVVVEALAAKTPVICTDSGGTRELVKESGIVLPDTSWDFQPHDLYQPPRLDFKRCAALIREQMANDFTFNLSHLDIDNVADRYISFFHQVLSE